MTPRNSTPLRRLALRRALALPVACAFSLALVLAVAPARGADDDTRQQMQSLDEQVQEIKSDVLRIAAELDQLEEKLLYPSNTQVAVFVSLPEGESLQLDSLAVRIDDEPVASHVYSFKELEALQKGGVQRIYTGNLPAGEHKIDVTVAGKRSSGSEITGSQSFVFQKEVLPKLLGISVAGREFGDAEVLIGSW